MSDLVIVVLASLVAIAVIAFVLLVRPQDLPEVEPVSPFRHLDERKASIYENLRDLQFEYRVGKLSDADYQGSKQSLQKELAAVMAEVDKLKAELNGHGHAAPHKPGKNRPQAGEADGSVRPTAPRSVAQAVSPAGSDSFTAPEGLQRAYGCSACGATFEKELKFCGECGKPMKVATQ